MAHRGGHHEGHDGGHEGGHDDPEYVFEDEECVCRVSLGSTRELAGAAGSRVLGEGALAAPLAAPLAAEAIVEIMRGVLERRGLGLAPYAPEPGSSPEGFLERFNSKKTRDALYCARSEETERVFAGMTFELTRRHPLVRQRLAGRAAGEKIRYSTPCAAVVFRTPASPAGYVVGDLEFSEAVFERLLGPPGP